MKIATASGPEMNELMAKRLGMEQLEMISGGVEDESLQDHCLKTIVKVIIVKVMRNVIKMHRFESFEKFWSFLKEHDTKMTMAIMAVNPAAAHVYSSMSWDEKRHIAEEAWNSR